MALSGVASAAPDTNRVSQTVVVVGSDTTYEVMNDLDQLYNESAGCAIIPFGTDPFVTYKQTCLASGTLAYSGNLIETENEYHDRIIEAYPVGSGNGATVLFQFTQNGAGTALAADASRSSSKRTLTAVAGFTQYEMAFARDGISYWVSRVNTHVTRNKANTAPTPNISSADLKSVFIGDGSPNTASTNGCAINWKKQKNGTKLINVDSVASKLGAPGAGNIIVYASQPGSGTSKDFANFLQAGKVGADLQNCVDPNFTDGTGPQHVLFENNATPICDDHTQGTAIFPYSFARSVQNQAGKGKCAGLLGAIDTKRPSQKTIGVGGGFPFGRYVYNYFYIPNGVDATDMTTWGNNAKAQAVLSYFDAVNGWLCRAGHSKDPFPGPNGGKNYRALIERTIRADGFVPLAPGATGSPYGTSTSFCRTNAVT